MNLNEKTKRDGEFSIEIDWLNVLKLLWKKAWLIILLAVVLGSSAFAYTKIFVAPKYSSSIMIYVNNTSKGDNISASELSVAQSLVNTYMTILCTQTTMNKLDEYLGDLEVTPAELKGMVTASGIADTEVFRVTVTTDNAKKAQIIAAGIAEVLPERIEKIVEGTSMRVVDEATYNPNPVSPNASKNAILGAAIGVAIACILIFIMAVLDDVIHSEDYVVETYHLPVLAKIPDLVIDEPVAKYGKYSKYKYKSYYKKNSYESK